jgi:tetratricopeptide (TPR) repeat protein
MTEIKSATDTKKVKEVKAMSLLKLTRVLLAVTGGVLLLLLLVAGYRFYRLSPQSLYEQAFVEYQLPREGDYLLGATEVEKAYQAANYKWVIRESKKKQPFTDLDYLLIGLAHLHLKDYSAAIDPLRLVNRWSQSDYKQEGEYYLALAYLQNKDYDKALELMQRIRRNENHPYHEQITGRLVRNVRILKWR